MLRTALLAATVTLAACSTGTAPRPGLSERAAVSARPAASERAVPAARTTASAPDSVRTGRRVATRVLAPELYRIRVADLPAPYASESARKGPRVVPPPADYDALAPVYHLIHGDWEAGVLRQGEALDALIRAPGPAGAADVLDAACGIGTQSLGLAGRGYRVTGSDLSPAAIARAGAEARQRGLDAAFSVADMRAAFEHHGRAFDVVLACDNSVPHLLTDAEIARAFGQFWRCTRPGGLCLVSVRDYDVMPREGVETQHHGVREEGGVRHVVFQVRDFRRGGGRTYEVALYVVADDGRACRTSVVRTTYYAIGTDRLLELMREAGFERVRRVDGAYVQPILIGHRGTA